MASDKWLRLLNDDLTDMQASVQKLKAEYWKKSFFLIILVIIGAALMGVAGNANLAAIGCFFAVTGIVGILSLANMCHNELCLYRAIREFRQVHDDGE